MHFKPYTIIETDLGPMISESRTSIYDVLITQQEGEDFDSICVIHNLRPLQVRVALEYIEMHRVELEAELPGILAQKAENERYHRAIAAERAQRPVVMTSERHAFYELLAKHREGNGTNGSYHPER